MYSLTVSLLSLIGPDIFLSTSFFKPQPMLLPACERRRFVRANKTVDKVAVLCVCIANWNTKYPMPNDSKHFLISLSL